MEEEIYTTPNDLEFSESELREEYGDRFDQLVAEGVFKKKVVEELVSVSDEPTSQADFNANDLEVLQKDFVFPATPNTPLSLIHI